MTTDTPFIPAAVEWACERGLLYVRLSGAIDVSVERDLSALIGRAGDAFRRAIIDLDSVTFFGAAGLNFLARLAGGRGIVQLISVPPQLPIRQQVRAAGLDGVVALPEAAPATPGPVRQRRSSAASSAGSASGNRSMSMVAVRIRMNVADG